MLTPTGRSFNWGDCGTGTNLSPAMFWLAEKTAKPSVLWSEKRFLEQSDFSKFKNIRYLPAVLIWAKNIPLGNISEPAEKFWMGQGLNPVSMMRTGWDGQAIYLGFKAGSPSVNHGHMDIGSFIVEADGLRWAMDLGMQNYESLESLGMSIFGKGQDAQRWTVFRMNTYSHSVLIVDNEQQRVNGYARIDNFSDDENFMFAISDISSVYKGQLKSVSRGVGIKDKNYVIIRDELETLEKTTKVRWQMLTGATVNITGNNTATLSQEGKQMTIRVDEPGNITLTTWSTQPVNNYDAPNPGTILIGFETEIPAGMLYTIQVKLIPGSSVTNAEFNKALSEW